MLRRLNPSVRSSQHFGIFSRKTPLKLNISAEKGKRWSTRIDHNVISKPISSTNNPIQTQGISYFTYLRDPSKYREKPSSVWVKGKDGTTKKMSVEDVEQMHRFRWKEDIVIPSEQIVNLKGKFSPPVFEKKLAELSYKPGLTQIKHYLANIDMYNNKMVLVDMEDLGFGVVANETFTNPNGDIVTFYAGEVNDDIYSDPTYKWDVIISNFHVSLDGIRSGNISRFMPHLPRLDDINPSYFPGIPLEEIATENVRVEYSYIAKNSIPVIYKEKDIQVGEPIGYSYGPKYWRDSSFWLLRKNCKKIAEVRYDAHKGIVPISVKSKY